MQTEGLTESTGQRHAPGQARTPACRGAVGAFAGSPSPLGASPHGRFGQLCATAAGGLFAQMGLPAEARKGAA